MQDIDDIDIGSLEQFLDDNPMEWSPEDLLEEIIDTTENSQLKIEAIHLLMDWRYEPPSLAMRHGLVDMLFAKYGIRDDGPEH